MKTSKLLLTFILLGIFSIIAVVYFYFIQRDFTKKHREFIILVDTLENHYKDTNNLILKNSIYMYINQDNISQSYKKVETDFNKLAKASILENKNYFKIKQDVQVLNKKLKEYIYNIEYFTRINANVKNSLLFLSRYIDEADALEKYDPNTLLKARIILKKFNDAKKLQDLTFLSTKDYLLESDNPIVQQYIGNFNRHSKYLMNNYPILLKTTKKIIEDDIRDKKLYNIMNNFSKIALNDFKALDEFAFILFSLFAISMITIIVLLIKYQKENKKLQEAHSSLEYSLTYDQLTDLYNRKKFESDINTIKNPFLILINIKDFKYINDVYGNNIGNILLKKLARFITVEMKSFNNSAIYRLGGDEFGVLFEETNEDKIFNIAKKLEQSISKHTFKIKNFDIELTVNIAVNNTRPIIENADITQKHIKTMKNIHVMKYDESLQLKENIEENMKMVQTIKDALIENRIIPFFQPIVNLQTSKIEKYEALVRLKLPNGEILPPFKFLDLSKKSSQYQEITKIMIEKTIDIAKEYPKYRFSVNVSMTDISDIKITNMLFSLLEDCKNSNAKIDIELLESEHLDNIDVVKKFIDKLHTYDSKILIDDFGTGYSNFSYFSHLDIDLVKIDASIVKEITKNGREYYMLKSIKEFANGMNMLTVSEFVENREIALKLKNLGATYAQGYYFSAPLEKPLDDENVII